MRLIFQQITFLFLATLIFGSNSLQAQEEKAAEAAEGKKIVFLAGAKSHGYAAHEHYAGCVLLAKSLEAALPSYETVVYKYDWPEDESAFDDVDCIVSYSDGGKRHPFSNRLEQVDALAQRGVGIKPLAGDTRPYAFYCIFFQGYWQSNAWPPPPSLS